MSRNRSLSALTAIVMVLAFLLTSLATGQPAEAAAKRPTITAKATPAVVTVGGSTSVIGTVSRQSRGATVKLERRSGGAWKTVKSSKVTKKKAFRFAVTIRDASTRFRVRVVKNKHLRSATSRIVTVTGTPAAATASPEVTAVRALILRKTNEFRAKNGLPALSETPALDTVAQQWSTHLATTGTFEHRSSFSAYPAGWTKAGENIAAGQAAEAVVDAWIDSPGHRANLLGDYDSIGIGYATGGPYGRYYTQNFAKYGR